MFGVTNSGSGVTNSGFRGYDLACLQMKARTL